MKQKLISACIYAFTAISVGLFLDGLYGGEPITSLKSLIYIATAGVVLFVAACVFSFFGLRTARLVGLIGAAISWPYFSVELSRVPWKDIMWFVRYRPYTVWAILALSLSTIYSVYQMRIIRQSRP